MIALVEKMSSFGREVEAKRGKTVDVSKLTDSQVDAVRRVIAEFNQANNSQKD